jgi:hypothetical protein
VYKLFFPELLTKKHTHPKKKNSKHVLMGLVLESGSISVKDVVQYFLPLAFYAEIGDLEMREWLQVKSFRPSQMVRRDTAPETRHGCPLMTWELFVLNFARKC